MKLKNVKSNIAKFKNSDSKIERVVFLYLRILFRLVNVPIKFFCEPDYRSIAVSKILRSRKLHQTTTKTFFNRYPDVFFASSCYFNHAKGLKILSFGCSTGEEVVSLREYFPNAEIIGADINRRCLKICRNRYYDPKIKFIFSNLKDLTKNGPYDAIFCMAVLQREPHRVQNENITNLSDLYPFKKFENMLIELDGILNVGGLLIVHYTQYLFEDIVIANRYIKYSNITQVTYGLPVFDKNGNKLNETVIPHSIYIKKC